MRIERSSCGETETGAAGPAGGAETGDGAREGQKLGSMVAQPRARSMPRVGADARGRVPRRGWGVVGAARRVLVAEVREVATTAPRAMKGRRGSVRRHGMRPTSVALQHRLITVDSERFDCSTRHDSRAHAQVGRGAHTRSNWHANAGGTAIAGRTHYCMGCAKLCTNCVGLTSPGAASFPLPATPAPAICASCIQA